MYSSRHTLRGLDREIFDVRPSLKPPAEIASDEYSSIQVPGVDVMPMQVN